jgi:hypothetical protein
MVADGNDVRPRCAPGPAVRLAKARIDAELVVRVLLARVLFTLMALKTAYRFKLLDVLWAFLSCIAELAKSGSVEKVFLFVRKDEAQVLDLLKTVRSSNRCCSLGCFHFLLCG